MNITINIAGTAWAATDDGNGESGSHSETDAHGEGHGGAFPPFDPSTFASQLLWLAITFGILYLLMGRVVIPRIGGILETRSDRISQDLDEAQRLKEESEAAQAAYEHELAEARNRAHKIGQDARDRAKAEADAERDRVEAELVEKLDESEKQIASIKAVAMKEVDGIAVSTTEAIIRQLLGSAATKAEVTKAVDASAKGGSQ